MSVRKRMLDAGENFAEKSDDGEDASPGPAQWTSGEISTLIAMVARNNHLYNTENPDYSIRDEVESAWHHISQTLGKTVRECRDKWYNLRTVYRRQLRAGQNGRTKTPQRWVWRDAMSFLMPYLRIVPSVKIVESNIESSSVECQRPDMISEVVLPQVKIERFVEYEGEQENTSNSPTPPKIYCLDDDEFEESAKKDATSWDFSGNSCAEELFLRSLLPDMKTLSPRSKAVFKLKVQQALFDCMFPDDDSDTRDNDT